MPKVTIDNRAVEVAEGTTILDAAAAVGIVIPTLCHLAEFGPDPSCFVCAVQVEGLPTLSPSCATVVADDMVVHTDTDDVRQARRVALELMLSDHVGDCVAPCTVACPAHLDIADFIHEMTRGDFRRAVEIIRQRIALPASLGRVCPAFCENVCRRGDLDEPVAVRSLRCFVAELDLASAAPFVPKCAAPSGKRVAIVGAGPAGLSAAYYLQQAGHAALLLEARDEPGGMFRYGIADWRLPRRVFDAEIEIIRRLGAQIRTGVRLGEDVSLEELRDEYDAVLLALGAQTRAGAPPESFSPRGHTTRGGQADLEFVKGLGLAVGQRGVEVDRQTMVTSLPGVFAAGNVVSGPNYGVHAVAAGRRAAVAIGQFLGGAEPSGEPRRLNVTMRDLSDDEKQRLYAADDPSSRVRPRAEGGEQAETGLDEHEARREAGRCLDCDCGKRDDCFLRRHAEDAGAVATRFRGQRRSFQRDVTHPDIVYESGKCIQCGRCIRIAEAAREELGLTFVGRGFAVRTAAPFSATLEVGLRQVALRCAEACPTGAICLRRDLRERTER